MKLICMIPARIGSTRVKKKNLRYLGDKPLVAHVIETCKKADVFDEIHLNSDGLIFKQIADEYGISFYHRNPKFAAPHVTNDLFMEDFLNNVECDYVMQINPTSPFLTVEDLRGFRDMLLEGKYDTIQVVERVQIEAIFDGKPLNYEVLKIMAESQDLKPVMFYCNGIMGFKRDTHQRNMQKFGAATHGGKGTVGYYELKGFSTIDIDNEEDFLLAEVVYNFLMQKNKKQPRYVSGKGRSTDNLIFDADRQRILIEDGVNRSTMHDYNKEVVSIPEIIKKNGTDKSWSHTVINSPSNSATLIAQLPGEGNRMHFHPDWDEWWYIIDGEWEWLVEGVPKIVKKGDVVFIERNRKHKITVKGDKMAIRLAVSRNDVEHVYEEGDY